MGSIRPSRDSLIIPPIDAVQRLLAGGNPHTEEVGKNGPRMNAEIAGRRLLNQGISRPRHRRPAEVVAWFGAVQAQEYTPAKWGLGLRMRDGARDADVEEAFARGEILRTHVLRPTWHFVTPTDIRWLLELTGPRVHRIMASYNRRLELDAEIIARGIGVVERVLRDGQYLTRAEIGERLGRAGLAFAGIRLAQFAMHAELDGVVCSGPRKGKQFTYALVAERAPNARRMSRDEALAELVLRYFRSHGPATVRDFVWWSGLTVADTKRGLEMTNARHETVDGRIYWSVDRRSSDAAPERQAHLLPIYDEYLIAYRDREAVPHAPPIVSENTPASGRSVVFQHALVIDGQVAGTWRWARTSVRMSVEATLMRTIAARERRTLADLVARFERFQGVPVQFTCV
jgi:hypothetical protein